MSRGKQAPKRTILADPKYHSLAIAKFVNYLMQDGKKTIAQAIVYDALEIAAKATKQEPVEIFEKVIEIAKPQVEVRSKRVGGANYQVPMPVLSGRGDTLAYRWILTAARSRSGKSMRERLASEFQDILEGVGGTMKKKDDVHRMAEANKAFAHFARRRR